VIKGTPNDDELNHQIQLERELSYQQIAAGQPCQLTGRQQLANQLRMDTREMLVFSTAFGLLGTGLILLPRTSLSGNPWVLGTLLVGLVGLLTRYLSFPSLACARTAGRSAVPTNLFLVSALLLAFTLVTFAPLLFMHFWAGMDEPVLFSMQHPWSTIYDQIAGRPLDGFEAWLANSIGGTTSSYLCLIIGLRWLTSLALYAIAMNYLGPGGATVASISSMLFIVNPSEEMRFALFTIPYDGAVFFLTVAAATYLYSYAEGSRLWLIVSCLSLIISLLHYEAGFVIAAIFPVSLMGIEYRRSILSWIWAWYFTTTLLALRLLIIFFSSSHLYQRNYLIDLASVPNYILPLSSQTFAFFYPLTMLPSRTVGTVLGIAAALFSFTWGIRWLRQRTSAIPLTKLLALLSGSALLIFVLSVFEAFVAANQGQVPDFRENPTLRLEFFSAPLQALFWASLIAASGSLIAKRVRHVWVSSISGIFVYLAVVGGFELQARGGPVNPYLSYKIESAILREAARQIPNLDQSTVIFFSLPDQMNSPFGWGNHLYFMSCLMFGRPAYQGHVAEDGGLWHRVYGYAGPPSQAIYAALGANKVAIFTVAPDYGVKYLETKYAPAAASNAPPAQACSIPRTDKPDFPFLAEN
jgi:hypothetical protein